MQQGRPMDAPYLPVIKFLSLLLAQLWLAHAIAFFAHEFSHAFVAWALGWKTNPLALHYPHPSVMVWLLQFGISQNVDEVPIFASGHGPQAALISGAGMVLGNALLTLPLSRWAYQSAVRRANDRWALLAYWTTVASVGNLIDYVPVRTFIQGTDLDQDMYAVERGLGWSPLLLLVVFGIPTAAVLVYFLLRIQPQTLTTIFPASKARRITLAVLTAFILFNFYGAAGWSGCGPVSYRLSVISVVVVAPLAALLGGFSVAQRVFGKHS